MTRLRSFAALLTAVALSGCGSEELLNITTPATGAQIKFYNFAVNAPGVNFYANDTKMTAILTSACTTNCAESTTGTAFGSVGNGGLYTQIAPGQYTLTAKIAAATDKDLVVSTAPASLADGKFYSLYTTGFYNTTAKSMESFLVEDALPALNFTTAYVRFVNVIPNAAPMTLYITNTATNAEMAVGPAVAYKTAGAFVAVPNGVYDLNTRTTGSSANAINRTAVSFVAGRVYTISSRGDMTVTGTTATNRPQLDNTINR
jgi:hypothetical protein